MDVGIKKANRDPVDGLAGKGQALALSLNSGWKETADSSKSSFAPPMHVTCTLSCLHITNNVKNKWGRQAK